jgi:hypothetical protein
MPLSSKLECLLASLVIVACSSSGDDGLFDEGPGGPGQGGNSTAGSAPSGGAPVNTGGSSDTGGAFGAVGGQGEQGSDGGSGDPGSGGSLPATGGGGGGQSDAGSSNGGTSSGGNGSGGSFNGGDDAGGNASGGTATGGNESGGSASGGTATGGSAGGGTATGGKPSAGDCQQTRAELDAALEKAQVCDPNADDQCLGFVDGECCPVPVNDPKSEAALEFSAAIARWNKACGGSVCAAILCFEPTTAVCESRPATSGRCVRKRGLSL